MARILAIDFGLKRVGLAVTDPLQITANALDTIENNKVLEYLKLYCESETVERIILGLPRRLDNTDTHATPHVHAFKTKLKTLFPAIPIELHDERFTSKMAMDAMITGGMKKKDRRKKENLDKISATIILQSYLDSKSFL